MKKPALTPEEKAVKIVRRALARAVFETQLPPRVVWMLVVEDIQRGDRG